MLHFGIDVFREKLDCAAVDEYGQRVKRARTFSNDAQGVLDLIGSDDAPGAGAGVAGAMDR